MVPLNIMKFHPGEYADITGNLESVEIWLINHRCRSQRTIFAGISADQYRQTVRIRHGEKLPAAEYTVDHSKHGIAHRNHCRMQIQLLDHNVAFDRLFIQNFAVGGSILYCRENCRSSLFQLSTFCLSTAETVFCLRSLISA